MFAGNLKDGVTGRLPKFGQTGTIGCATTSGPAYDPQTIITNHARQLADMQYTGDKIDGTLIMWGDAPSTADKLMIGGEEHAVVNVKPLSPAGLVVFLEVQVRR